MLPEAVPAALAPEQYAQRITAAWGKTLESILDCGRALLEAKAELPHGTFTRMVEEKLPFSIRTAQSLMSIANHPGLTNAKALSYLPASSSVLALLARLPGQELADAIKTGAISPDLTFEEAKALVAGSRYVARQIRAEAGPAPELTALGRVIRESVGQPSPGDAEVRRLPRPATIEGEAQRLAEDAPDVVELAVVSNTVTVNETTEAERVQVEAPTPEPAAPKLERIASAERPAPTPAAVTLSWRDEPKDVIYNFGQFVKKAPDHDVVAELALRCVDALKADPARLVRVRNRIAKHRTGKPLGQGEFFEALAPILVGLEAEGQKNMATANPGAVAVLSHKLALLAETYAATVESEK